jgi:hypothetical protein
MRPMGLRPMKTIGNLGRIGRRTVTGHAASVQTSPPLLRSITIVVSIAMLRSLRIPLLRASGSIRLHAFQRPLAVASTQSITEPPAIATAGPLARLYDHEPKKPNVITDLPGPKVRATKEAMGKIQDVRRNYVVQ